MRKYAVSKINQFRTGVYLRVGDHVDISPLIDFIYTFCLYIVIISDY